MEAARREELQKALPVELGGVDSLVGGGLEDTRAVSFSQHAGINKASTSQVMGCG